MKRVYDDEEKKVVQELSVAKLFAKDAKAAYSRFFNDYSKLRNDLLDIYYSCPPKISSKFTERDEKMLQRHHDKQLHARQYLGDLDELEYIMLGVTCIRRVTEAQYEKYSCSDAYDTEEVLSTEYVKILRIQKYYLVRLAPLSSL